jgi:opacity protein-like surface antigen
MKNWKNKTKGLLGAGLTMGTALCGATAHAAPAAGADNLYVGGNLSLNRTNGLGSSIDGALMGQGIASSSTTDKASTNPDFRVGYKFNPNFAIEGSYDRLGSLGVQSTISSPIADTASGSWTSRGLGLHAIGIAPVTDKWSIYGRVGLEQWHTQASIASNAGGATSASASSNAVSLALGAGASYALSNNVDATGEYIRYTRAGNANTTGSTPVNQFSVGLRFHFL